MVILGLGSNLGDRLNCLRRALHLLKQIPHFQVEYVSPLYISDALLPENAPASWNMPYLNLALRCNTTLPPFELLQHTKKIEQPLGHTLEKRWGPRHIDIDILAWDDLIQYDDKLHIPHEHLAARPFALWPLTDVAPFWVHPIQKKSAVEIAAQWGSRFTGEAPLHCRQIPHRIDTPQLVGILNITPDSFSDGGKFFDVSSSLKQVHYLVNSGAEIIDIGAEATGPNTTSLDSATEWQRLEPILKNMMNERTKMLIPAKISVDTRHAEVAKKALDAGIDWINDVSGLEDPVMPQLIKESPCKAVFMHHLGIPVDKNHVLPLHQDPVKLIYHWAEQRLAEIEQIGISRERLIFDVGIGYGKTAEQSLELIKNIHVFQSLQVQLLIGHSRKSFLTQFTPQPADQRDIETVAVSLYLAKLEVDYLRVHDVEAHARMLKVTAALHSQ